MQMCARRKCNSYRSASEAIVPDPPDESCGSCESDATSSQQAAERLAEFEEELRPCPLSRCNVRIVQLSSGKALNDCSHESDLAEGAGAQTEGTSKVGISPTVSFRMQVHDRNHVRESRHQHNSAVRRRS